MDYWNAFEGEAIGPPGEKELAMMAAFEAMEYEDDEVDATSYAQAVAAQATQSLVQRPVAVAKIDDAASPLEELCATVGLIDVTKRYSTRLKEVVPHDFRWKSKVSDLLYEGEPVLQVVFPPAKLDVVPRSISDSLARRGATYEVLSGKGDHIFMGAVPVCASIMATMMVVTPSLTRYFTLTRTTIIESQGPVAAWSEGCPRFFDTGGVVWNQHLTHGDNVVMVDGDLWYYPQELRPTVLVEGGVIRDRNRVQLEERLVLEPDGLYAYDLRSRSLMRSPIRPPVSKETYASWQKFRPFPMKLYGAGERRHEFEFHTASTRVTIQMLQEDKLLISPAMSRKTAKFREICRQAFMASVRDAYLFPEWECMQQGRIWSMFECVDGLLQPPPSYWVVHGRLGKTPVTLWLPVGRERAFFSAYSRKNGRLHALRSELVGVLPGEWQGVAMWRSEEAVASARQRDWARRVRCVEAPLRLLLDQLWD